MDRTLQFLADYAISLTYQRLPSEVVHQIKQRLIDSLGCALGAYMEKPSRIARAYAMEATANPGATVLGTRHRTVPELAAFANGVMVRYLDFNDTDRGHPSDNIPPVLAAAEYAGSDARTAITGIVLAYEMQLRFVDAVHLGKRGWDYVSYTALASAAGAGKAMNLSGEQMANALALAVTPNTALRQARVGKLSMWKGGASANAGRNGLFAALMARRGMTGPEEAFEGLAGFFKQVTGPLRLPPFGGNGHPFKVQDTKLKYYPAEYEAQAAIHPALELRQALGGRIDQIEKVIVQTSARAVEIAADTLDKWNPQTRETADHSIPYILAVALSKGSLWLDDFSEARITDPRLHALMQLIEVQSNPEYSQAYPDASCFHIEVITHSGDRYVRETRYAKGHPKNPMTDQEIEAKFRRLAEPVLGARPMDQILSRLWHVEDVQNLSEILSLFEI